MGIFSNIFISGSVSVDTLALGYQSRSSTLEHLKRSFIVATFQTILMIVGFSLGGKILPFIENIDHWVIFALLSIVGINTMMEEEDSSWETKRSDLMKFLFLSFVVSIDCVAVGFTLIGEIELNHVFLITLFSITALSYLAGVKFSKWKQTRNFRFTKIFAGSFLILIGLKILITHVLDHGFF